MLRYHLNGHSGELFLLIKVVVQNITQSIVEENGKCNKNIN